MATGALAPWLRPAAKPDELQRVNWSVIQTLGSPDPRASSWERGRTGDIRGRGIKVICVRMGLGCRWRRQVTNGNRAAAWRRVASVLALPLLSACQERDEQARSRCVIVFEMPPPGARSLEPLAVRRTGCAAEEGESRSGPVKPTRNGDSGERTQVSGFRIASV